MRNAYIELGCAVILQAVYDYRRAIKSDDCRTAENILQWLSGDWARLLMGDIDPQFIIEKLREETRKP